MRLPLPVLGSDPGSEHLVIDARSFIQHPHPGFIRNSLIPVQHT